MHPSNTDSSASSVNVEGRRRTPEGRDGADDWLIRTVDADRRVSTAVVMMVAELAGVEPTDLHPRLHDVVNPDALDSLLGRREHEGTVDRLTFTWYGCRVIVRGDGRVAVGRIEADEP